MRVNYKGMDKDFQYRIAEILFKESDEKESKLFHKVSQVLEIKGWTVDHVTEGYAIVRVVDKEEYNMFVEDYKRIKHSARLWVKYGM